MPASSFATNSTETPSVPLSDPSLAAIKYYASRETETLPELEAKLEVAGQRQLVLRLLGKSEDVKAAYRRITEPPRDRTESLRGTTAKTGARRKK